MKNIYLTFFWLALCFCVIIFAFKVYAEVNTPNHIWYDMRGKNLKEWKLEDHIKKPEVKPEPKPIIKAQNKPVEQRKEEKSIKVAPPVNKEPREFDLVKFSRAVAKHETASCTK
jgi:hypothetical protein